MVNSIPIVLSNELEKFVRNEITSGRYDSIDEVISAALKLLKSEEIKEKELIDALEAGEQSGFLDAFDPSENLKKLHRQYT